MEPLDLKPPPIENPLVALTKAMGLTTKTAARLAGVPFGCAREALSETPGANLDAYIRIAAAMGLHYRLRRAAPIRIWLSRSRLDGLFFDEPFRRSRQFPRLPADRKALRDYLFFLRGEKKKTLQAIVDHVHRGFIPTAEGGRAWSRSLVSQYLRNRRRSMTDATHAIVPGEEMMALWRDHLIDELLQACSGHDAFFQVRYGLSRRTEPDRLVIESTSVLTEKPREWFFQGLKGLAWIADAWGEIQSPEYSRISSV